VEAVVGQIRPTVVFNLAGYGVDRTERDDRLAREINADLPQALAAILSERGHGDWPGYALVHTGSALEYGAVGGDLAESGIENPTTLYGITKLAGTRAIQRCGETTGFRGITARLFTVYGPGEHDGRLVPTLVAATQHSEPILLSEGLQRRDFTYVEDVVEGLLRLGTARGPAGWTVNLATGNLASVRDFTEIAARVLLLDPARLRFGAVPARPEEMEHLAVTVERLRKLLGWTPTTDPTAGLARTAEWFARQRPPEPA
jgi:nucleoside-diphosphate-sugar epimerase